MEETVIEIVCPYCGFKNSFPGYGYVDVFLCDECEMSVEPNKADKELPIQ